MMDTSAGIAPICDQLRTVTSALPGVWRRPAALCANMRYDMYPCTPTLFVLNSMHYNLMYTTRTYTNGIIGAIANQPFCRPSCFQRQPALSLCATNITGTLVPVSTPLQSAQCRSSADCPSTQACDLSAASCTPSTTCNPITGEDQVACIGQCRSRCELVAPQLAEQNKGTCNTDADCASLGGLLTCTPAPAGTPCRQLVCQSSPSVQIVQQSCTGFCTEVGACCTVTTQSISPTRRRRRCCNRHAFPTMACACC